jgi:hypothetical protein
MLTTMIEGLAQDLPQELPADGLEHAVDAVIETCGVQLDWAFAPLDDPSPPDVDSACRGSTIALTSQGGTWLLIALCDLESSHSLTRALFAMDEDEDVCIEDSADALNEVMNVAAGVFKARRNAQGEKLNIGLPTYLDGEEAVCHLSERVARRSRTIGTDDGVRIRLIAFWQEGAGHDGLHA